MNRMNRSDLSGLSWNWSFEHSFQHYTLAALMLTYELLTKVLVKIAWTDQTAYKMQIPSADCNGHDREYHHYDESNEYIGKSCQRRSGDLLFEEREWEHSRHNNRGVIIPKEDRSAVYFHCVEIPIQWKPLQQKYAPTINLHEMVSAIVQFFPPTNKNSPKLSISGIAFVIDAPAVTDIRNLTAGVEYQWTSREHLD